MKRTLKQNIILKGDNVGKGVGRRILDICVSSKGEIMQMPWSFRPHVRGVEPRVIVAGGPSMRSGNIRLSRREAGFLPDRSAVEDNPRYYPVTRG